MSYQRDPRVDAYIAGLEDWQQAICEEVLDMVHSVDPEVEETIKFRGRPYFVLAGNVCALLASKGHVNVFLYNGAIVPDPDGIITGGHGNSTARTVAVRREEAVPAKPLGRMLGEIIANNRAGGWRPQGRRTDPAQKEVSGSIQGTVCVGSPPLDRMEPVMRRLIALALPMMLFFVAAGCGGADTSDSPTASATGDPSVASTTTGASATSTTGAQSEGEPTDGSDDDGEDPGDGSTGGDATLSTGPYGWTVECVASMVTHLKILEPALAAIDWSTATAFEESDINAQFADEADVVTGVMAEHGCGEEMFSTADGLGFMRALAVAHAPGAVAYLDYFIEDLP